MESKVLIAEDDPTTREFVVEMLSLEGYDVYAVADGRRATEALDSFKPHVAVLDVMMPEEDGVSVLRTIRNRPDTEGLPVILLTAKVDDSATWEGWQAGCNYYMPKPFDPEELASAVERLIASRRDVR